MPRGVSRVRAGIFVMSRITTRCIVADSVSGRVGAAVVRGDSAIGVGDSGSGEP